MCDPQSIQVTLAVQWLPADDHSRILRRPCLGISKPQAIFADFSLLDFSLLVEARWQIDLMPVRLPKRDGQVPSALPSPDISLSS